MRNTTGIHYYNDGDYYDGEWINDRRVGRGKIYLAHGGKINGQFQSDQAECRVEFEDKNGNMISTDQEESKKGPAASKQPSSKNVLQTIFKKGTFQNGRLYK
jgi:hypothetical protein